MNGAAVVVDDLSKRFRLYHERNQTLKATLLQRRRVRYEEFWALRHVDLQVPEGTTYGLIGENGSGKSTLLKCMARILHPDEGSLAVHGKMSALLELGAGFHPDLSGRENVYLNGSILGLGKRDIERKFDDIVEFAGLERFIDTPVKNYSSGMYVRLGFSVAINVEPEVLLVDEVLAVGDEQFQRKCQEKFADLRGEGRTIVVVSHALETVRTMCDRVAWLRHGELVDEGAAPTVVDDYLGASHGVRQSDEGTGERWGTGVGKIERVELLDRDDRPATRVRTGERVSFRLHFSLDEVIEDATFTLRIRTVDGMDVTVPNTHDVPGAVPSQLEGEGHVELLVERLMLLPGTYDVSVGLRDRNGRRELDIRPGCFRFDVLPGVPHERFGGVVALGGTWRMLSRGGRR